LIVQTFSYGRRGSDVREQKQIRVFSFRYRKTAGAMIPEKECHCGQEEDGTYKEGDIWHYESGDDVWVKVAAPFFRNPTTEQGNKEVEEAFDQCLRAADQWIQGRYREMHLK
jgi:hypothetical protein